MSNPFYPFCPKCDEFHPGGDCKAKAVVSEPPCTCMRTDIDHCPKHAHQAPCTCMRTGIDYCPTHGS